MGPQVSGSPSIPHYAVFLFSTNKIFLTSAAGVCLGFHSQSGIKNSEHLKFLHMSSVHHAHSAYLHTHFLRTKQYDGPLKRVCKSRLLCVLKQHPSVLLNILFYKLLLLPTGSSSDPHPSLTLPHTCCS
jgi:hypothetical protein